MKLATFLSIVGVIAILFGIGFLLAPAALLGQYGIVVADPHTILMSRFFGATLIELGILVWIAREIVDPLARRAIVLAGLIGNVAGFVVALTGQLNGAVNALGWSTVLIYALFAIGFACFQFGKTS